MHRTSLLLALAVAALLIMTASLSPAAVLPIAAPETFPDEWHFDGRPQELVDLIGKPAPDITGSEWIGDATSIADARGDVVVLDFWGTWCGPCVAAIPKNIELLDEYGDQGLTFIGVHTEGGWDKAPAMVQEKGVNYPSVRDGSGAATAKAYHVSFYPTYVVIDRAGVIRAVGLIPSHVGDVVKALLAEDGPAREPESLGEFELDWYLGGETRLDVWMELEGGPAPEIQVAAWAGDAPELGKHKTSVRVIHFVRPELGVSLSALRAFDEIAKEYENQGVFFAALCDAGSAWDAMISAAQRMEILVPIAHDRGVPPVGDGGPREAGLTASAFGVRYAPVTAVIDRNGRCRAIGPKPEHLKDIIDQLMAEPYTSPGTAGTDSEGAVTP
ncbi:MAG: redoxin domain-containing protein [Planctomycetota bacterium]